MQGGGGVGLSGALHDAGSATVLTPTEGDVLMTDGPDVDGTEHLGGFTVIEASDLDAALDWGRKLACAVTLPVEVRPFGHG